MGADFSIAGRVRNEGAAGAGFLSFDDVEARLIEAVQLQWRLERGRWPFASDGPWHLIRKEWEDWDARDPKPMPRVPLSMAEQARMQEAFGWLLLVPDDWHRRIILSAVTERAKGHARVPWRKLSMSGLGDASPDGMRMAFIRAMGDLTKRVNVNASR